MSFFGLGFAELVVIAIVTLIVVGPKRLPTVARTIGKGIRTLRRAGAELRDAVDIDEVRRDVNEFKRDVYDQTVGDWHRYDDDEVVVDTVPPPSADVTTTNAEPGDKPERDQSPAKASGEPSEAHLDGDSAEDLDEDDGRPVSLGGLPPPRVRTLEPSTEEPVLTEEDAPSATTPTQRAEHGNDDAEPAV